MQTELSCSRMNHHMMRKKGQDSFHELFYCTLISQSCDADGLRIRIGTMMDEHCSLLYLKGKNIRSFTTKNLYCMCLIRSNDVWTSSAQAISKDFFLPRMLSRGSWCHVEEWSPIRSCGIDICSQNFSKKFVYKLSSLTQRVIGNKWRIVVLRNTSVQLLCWKTIEDNRTHITVPLEY